MDLSEKNVLITGGSSGIGKATAKYMVQKGANVTITGRDQEKLKAVADKLGIHFFAANVADQKDVKATFEDFMKRHDRLDVLINNAGIGGKRLLLDEMDMEAMREVYDVNVFGAVMMASEASRLFKKQKKGNIVNIASTAAVKGYEGGTIYSSSKFALRGLSKSWQAELRPFNVRVINVNPSYVATAFGEEDREERPEEANKLRGEEIAHAVVSALEMDDRGYIPELTVHATNPF